MKPRITASALTTWNGRFIFTATQGQQYIAGLGLNYFKARWYSPTMGRFLETDPIGYGDGVNWYAYVGNSPVNTNDPSEELGWSSAVGAIIGYIGGGLGSATYQYALVALLPIDGDVVDTTLMLCDEFFRLNEHAAQAAAGVKYPAFVKLQHRHSSSTMLRGV